MQSGPQYINLDDHELLFRPAVPEDIPAVWTIIVQAKEKRKLEGSDQWQDGYPSEKTIAEDIIAGQGFVLVFEGKLIAYVAVIFDGEPAYEDIDGDWLNNDPFAVVHRLAVIQGSQYRGIGTLVMTKIEEWVLSKGVFNIKVDTNFDNQAMLRVFEKRGYAYCGIVVLRGNAFRKAFQKQLI